MNFRDYLKKQEEKEILKESIDVKFYLTSEGAVTYTFYIGTLPKETYEEGKRVGSFFPANVMNRKAVSLKEFLGTNVECINQGYDTFGKRFAPAVMNMEKDFSKRVEANMDIKKAKDTDDALKILLKYVKITAKGIKLPKVI